MGTKQQKTRIGENEKQSYSNMMDAAITFHTAFNLPQQGTPNAAIGEQLAKIRVALLEEEVGEYIDAIAQSDIVAIADALADIVYVIYGTAVTYGINLDRVLEEVHRSNMSKLDGNGNPILREDGKVIKSDQYTRPDIAGLLLRQQPIM